MILSDGRQQQQPHRDADSNIKASDPVLPTVADKIRSQRRANPSDAMDGANAVFRVRPSPSGEPEPEVKKQKRVSKPKVRTGCITW